VSCPSAAEDDVAPRRRAAAVGRALILALAAASSARSQVEITDELREDTGEVGEERNDSDAWYVMLGESF
jgi:hypothetical protein